MAFYIGTDKVISDTDASSGISTNSDLDKLQINGTDILTHSGGVVTLKNVTFDDASEVTINTDNLTQGSTNLFYATSLFNTDFASKSTSDLAEGTNLYYTDARAISAVQSQSINLGSNNITTTGKILFSNVYATEGDLPSASTYHGMFAHVHATGKGYYAHSGNWIKLIDETSSTTTNLTEGSNLYYTDARVNALLGGGGGTTYATETFVSTAISNLVDTAPATLDTLNELAAALGDDANFSTTITNQIAALTHDGFADFVANEHIDWTSASAGTIHASNYTDTNTTYVSSDFTHDDLTGFVANEHIDWTAASAGTIDPSNYVNTNTNTTYTAGTGLTLTGTVFSNDITNNNQLTNGAGYITSFTDTNTTYTAGNGLTLTGTEFTMSGSYTGDFTATGDVTAYSDKRLKRNIETISNPVDIVNCLRGVNFEKDGRHSTGVIAQEVEEFLPEVVHTDAEGMKSVAYGNITGLLIEAIKEQQQTIENLQKQITDLQNKNS